MPKIELNNVFLNGQKRSAMRYFFAANQYWRMADVFLPDRNDDKAAYFKKMQNFRSAAALHDPRLRLSKSAVVMRHTMDTFAIHGTQSLENGRLSFSLVAQMHSLKKYIFQGGK